jgi:hypothetical protein
MDHHWITNRSPLIVTNSDSLSPMASMAPLVPLSQLNRHFHQANRSPLPPFDRQRTSDVINGSLDHLYRHWLSLAIVTFRSPFNGDLRQLPLAPGCTICAIGPNSNLI